MRYALVDSLKVEPVPRLTGECIRCGAVMIAKCGEHKLWHWAHKSRIHCDPWWEPETDWHRTWKSHFAPEWQEVVHFAPASGEKHVADVKTAHGKVIEFQHSPMKPEELRSRESFYVDLVWIVDGNRGFDASYFNMGLGQQVDEEDSGTVFPFYWYGRSKLIQIWNAATCPVFFDFGHERIVWRLVFYDPQKKRGIVGPIYREKLISDLTDGTQLARIIRGDADPA